jgi:hypothetical protein
MTAAATSGGLPFASRRSMTRSIAVNVSAYRARPSGVAAGRDRLLDISARAQLAAEVTRRRDV